MKITVHSDYNHIGGCVTEYESNGWKLFVDYGKHLQCAIVSDHKLEIDGQNCGDIRESAMLITLYHGDQIGKITFTPRERFSFGEFEITPIVVDHSAFDAYAFCIEAKKLKVIHIGGFSESKLLKHIERSIGRVDYIVCEAIGSDYRYEMNSLDKLFSALQPKAIIPIHTDNPQAFADLFCDKWPVILLNDGETFSAIKDGWYDNTIAKIFAYQLPDKTDEIVENPKNLRYWSLDKRILGEFECLKDAEFALHHAIYAPNRQLAYSIESNEDMVPLLYTVYSPDFTEYSEYSMGGHDPKGNNYQEEKSAFSHGDKVWAIIDNEVLIPCTFIGPTSEEFFKEKDEPVSQLWDWDWDSVIVRPLVNVETEFIETSSDTSAQRIYVFPYRELKL